MAIRKSPEAQLADVQKHFDRTIKGLLSELPQIVQEAGEMILDEAMPLVPEDTGALRESGDVQSGPRTTTGRPGAHAIVSFGGNKPVRSTRNAPNGVVDYAVIVHEDLEANHPVGQAKFLEEGARRSIRKARDHIIKRIQGVMRRSSRGRV